VAKRTPKPLHKINRIPLLEYSLVSVPPNPESLTSFTMSELKQRELKRRESLKIDKHIPQFVTAETLGDATALTDASRVFGLGYECECDAAGFYLPRDWTARHMPAFAFRRERSTTAPNHFLSFKAVSDIHPLGVTYLLDFADKASLNPWRLKYSGPRTTEHRTRVVWAGSGDFCIADDCEGWDAVIAHGTYDHTALIVAKWRGSRRVWLGFGASRLIDEPDSEYVWSGLAGFEGGIAKLASGQSFSGELPTRVLFENVCENYRLPLPLVSIARRCGFYVYT
jgi:hypothetical protein